ncbi:MAG: cyclic nucleotide-binding domain-containing protein [Chloroflexi bacterium]|nr:cyclic nucleotide-binding domain-containing protein [Chloroflexota bacterium]
MPLFAALRESDLAHLSTQGVWQRREAGDILFRKGEEPRAFYVVYSGRIELHDELGDIEHNAKVGTILPNGYIGASNLLTGQPYTYTAIVPVTTELFVLRKRYFYQLLAQHPELAAFLQSSDGNAGTAHASEEFGQATTPPKDDAELHQRILNRLKEIPLFEKLSEEERAQIASLMYWEQHPPNTVLCQQGEIGRTFYLIDRGLVIVRHADDRGIQRVLNQLAEGDFFGETSLLTGEARDATVTTLQDVEVFVLNKDDFDQLLEEYPNIRRELNIRGEIREKLSARRFSGREEGEFAVAFERKHPFILLKTLLWPMLVALLVAIALGAGVYAGIIAGRFALWTGTFAAIPWLLWIVWVAYDWYNDDYIVTDRRVIHIERVLFFFEERHEAALEKIQNINMITPGPLARWLNFHDLIIQTAGSKGNIMFRSIPRAEMVRDLINQQKSRIYAPERAAERERMRQELREEFGWSASTPAASKEELSDLSPAEEERRLGQIGNLLGGIAEYFLPRMRIEEGDTITWRKHWFVLLSVAWKPALLTFVLLAFLVVMAFTPSSLDPSLTRWLAGALVVALLVAIARLWWQYEDWRNDIYILSNSDIKDIDRQPLWLHQEVRQASLGQVQDVRYEIPGPLAVLLRFGNVLIETAGKSGLLTFESVANPAEIQEEIFQRIQQFERNKKKREWADRRAEMIHALGSYHEVMQERPAANVNEVSAAADFVREVS